MDHEKSQAVRIADRDVYLNEDRFDSPKEFFKSAYQEIQKDIPECQSIMDVGCATGEFLYYLKKQMPGIKTIAGIDVIPEFFDVARKKVPDGRYSLASIEDTNFMVQEQYDLVTVLGVISIMFDIELVLKNLFALTRSGGFIYILSNFNEQPIDTHVTYRRAGVSNLWEKGFNVYSMRTMEALTQKLGGSYTWVEFRMPFAIPKTNDPMRGWTEPFRNNPHTVIYGTSQFTTLKFLKIKVS